jgi:hypothetical protein
LKVEDFRIYGEELFWRYPGASCNTDEVHLNGITVSNNRLIATAFGPRNDGKWGSHGCVFYPETGEVISEGLRQPHTPICSQDALFFTESAAGAVHVYKRKAKGKWIHGERIQTGGYARGIALLDERLYIGISSMRNVSRSQGVMLGEQDLISRAGIMCFNLQDLSLESVSDLSFFTREIYDILPLERGIALDSFFGALSDRAREMQNSGERFADQVARMHMILNKANRDQLQLEAEKQQLMTELGGILSSLTWRLTAPVRLLGRRCKQLLDNRSWF